MTSPELATLAKLIAHFARYGECYRRELGVDTDRWLIELSQTDWVKPVGPDAFQASARLLQVTCLPGEQEWLRYICFSLPAYRHYLLMVLVQGLVMAARTDYDELDDWIFTKLNHLTQELNHVLDEIETLDHRVVDWPDAEVRQFFTDWHQRHDPPAAWNHDLLNLHNSHDQMFPAVLERAQYFTAPEPTIQRELPVTLMLRFELPLDSSSRPTVPQPAAWCTARRQVHSSLPMYDAEGRCLFAADWPAMQVWQDGLARQPYYRAVLRAAIAAHFSPYSAMPIRLSIAPDAPDLGHVVVVRNERTVAPLQELLLPLLDLMGYHTFAPVSSADLAQILRHWSAIGVLTTNTGDILLTPGFQQSLHQRHLATLLLRGSARDEQARIDKFLREVGRD
jgi:hypothetical protein